MKKVLTFIGLIAGVIMLSSSGAHSIYGWQEMHAQLEAQKVSADLQRAVQIGWMFGGVAILAFGIIVTFTFWKRLQGRSLRLFHAGIIGSVYFLFGCWALYVTGYNPFYTIFIVPGLMVLGAAAGSRDR